MNALAAFSNAHITMHEVLYFKTCALLKEGQLRESHFTAYNDTGNAILLQLFDGMLVVGVHHNRGMKRYVHSQLPGQL